MNTQIPIPNGNAYMIMFNVIMFNVATPRDARCPGEALANLVGMAHAKVHCACTW